MNVIYIFRPNGIFKIIKTEMETLTYLNGLDENFLWYKESKSERKKLHLHTASDGNNTFIRYPKKGTKTRY